MNIKTECDESTFDFTPIADAQSVKENHYHMNECMQKYCHGTLQKIETEITKLTDAISFLNDEEYSYPKLRYIATIPFVVDTVVSLVNNLLLGEITDCVTSHCNVINGGNKINTLDGEDTILNDLQSNWNKDDFLKLVNSKIIVYFTGSSSTAKQNLHASLDKVVELTCKYISLSNRTKVNAFVMEFRDNLYKNELRLALNDVISNVNQFHLNIRAWLLGLLDRQLRNKMIIQKPWMTRQDINTLNLNYGHLRTAYTNQNDKTIKDFKIAVQISRLIFLLTNKAHYSYKPPIEYKIFYEFVPKSFFMTNYKLLLIE
jgi:hypothetical protein